MTTEIQPLGCNEVQMAALAHLDGERALLTSDDVAAHTAGCGSCRAALAGLTTLHRALEYEEYERLDVDLWPAIRQRLGSASSSYRRAELVAFLGLTVVLVAWRLGQLLLDWPAPVVNSIVPLVLIVVVIGRIAGDPFAIRSSSQFRQQEGAL